MKILKTIGQFLINLWPWSRERKFKKINKTLQQAVVEQEKERVEFLQEFRFYLRKYLRKDASGKYIPIKSKNKAEIYETVMAVHGARLRELNIKFSKNLRISL
ncbi:hypothetical protein VS868_12005 [Salinimicrobium sp. 3283s]|uniref:hypothetical protein n=1 Tax=Salinimicrobium sp. 3283s TaxID=3114359 RepID=UPI0031ED417C